MAGWTCAACTTAYTVGAAKCPQCGSTERADQPGGAVLPSVTVACANDVCRYAGRQRRVHLRTAAPGVLEMPPLFCASCGFAMPTVAPWPPINEPEDNGMAKITVHGGPSNAAADEQEAGEDVSVGTSSSTSSEKEPSSPAPSSSEDPSPARTTGSRSKKAATGKGSSARSTGGGQAAGTSETDSAEAGA
jgi:hypothetical protein